MSDTAKSNITCTTSDCENDLHCFRMTAKLINNNHPDGACRECGRKLVDRTRVKKRDISDVQHTFAALRKEFIRHHFFHVEFGPKDLAKAKKKGREKINAEIRPLLEKKIGKANPSFDGRQTAFKGNILFYAQHATACCCRKCLEDWHGIPRGVELTSAEIDYLANLVELYLDERLPGQLESRDEV